MRTLNWDTATGCVMYLWKCCRTWLIFLGARLTQTVAPWSPERFYQYPHKYTSKIDRFGWLSAYHRSQNQYPCICWIISHNTYQCRCCKDKTTSPQSNRSCSTHVDLRFEIWDFGQKVQNVTFQRRLFPSWYDCCVLAVCGLSAEPG